MVKRNIAFFLFGGGGGGERGEGFHPKNTNYSESEFNSNTSTRLANLRIGLKEFCVQINGFALIGQRPETLNNCVATQSRR